MKSASNCIGIDLDSVAGRVSNKILNGGCLENGEWACDDWYDGKNPSKDPTIGKCKRAEAEFVFEYMGVMISIGLVFLGFVLSRRGGTRPTQV
jgi:hypothetical protein